MTPSILSNLTNAPEARKTTEGKASEVPQGADFEQVYGFVRQGTPKGDGSIPGADSPKKQALEGADLHSESPENMDDLATLAVSHDANRDPSRVVLPIQADPQKDHLSDMHKTNTSAADLTTVNREKSGKDIYISIDSTIGGTPVDGTVQAEHYGDEDTSHRVLFPQTGVSRDQPSRDSQSISGGLRAGIGGEKTTVTEGVESTNLAVPDVRKLDAATETVGEDDALLSSTEETETRRSWGSGAADQPTLKRELVAQMSMIERHLNGHPTTLITPDKASKLTHVQIQDIIRFDGDDRYMRDTSVLPSSATNTVSGLAPQVNSLGSAKLLKATGLTVNYSGLAQNDGEIEPFANRVVDEIGWDGRLHMQAAQAAQVTKADMAGAVSQQIAEAVRKSPDKLIEIALNPVELGRVRMVLSASDAGIVVSILAERSDTLDLLRRNIDDLGKSFTDIGYEDISFSFEQGDQRPEGFEQEQTETPVFGPDESMTLDAANAPLRHNSTLAIAPDGIDMRL